MRKLRDGTEFKIGKSFVRIRNKETKLSLTVPKDEISVRGIVTPKMIVDYIYDGRISNDISRYFESCAHRNSERVLRVNPFAREIQEKTLYFFTCDECYDRLTDDI